MSRPKGKMYLSRNELKDYMLKFIEELERSGCSEAEVEKRIAAHYSNKVIRKYSKQEQDAFWNEIYKTIMDVPGGYWQIVDNMDYMPEFEHYRFRKCHSHWEKQKHL
jgi:hypothetical protein